jgi:hypothetical protein
VPNAIKAPLIWVVALAAIGLAVACGGTAAQYDGLSDEEAAELRGAVDAWLADFHAAKFADIDRDFFYCYGPADPIPATTPTPDPSGHSRARLLCPQAAERVKESAGTYRELFSRLETLAIPEADAAVELRNDLVEIYRLRLAVFEEIVSALDAGNDAALADLRQRYGEMAVAEAKVPAIIAEIEGPEG